jgi:L-alanine-DL-glutamate epimerase-like enolase superfamily enzyme
MKITRIETITVVVPVREGAWHSAEFTPEGYTYGGRWVNLHWPDFPIVLIRVHTDEGLIGLGEVAKGVPESTVLQAAEAFEGRDLWSFNLQDLPLESMWFANPAISAAFEMALFDLMGKALNVPAYRLLGGKYRDRVAVSRCSGRMTPEDAAKTARESVQAGYSVLKMKATADDPLPDRLEAIQDEVGDKLQVVIDPNQRFYQPAKLFEIEQKLQARGITNIQCFESPFDQSNLDWYVLARQRLAVPIALHLSSLSDVREAIKHEACDWMNISGSMMTVFKEAALTEAAGIPTWHGSGVDLGISEAASVHVTAACRTMTLTSDICGESLRVDDLIVEPLVIEGGYVQVPERPGLGVELDEEAVERYRVRS